MTTQQLRDHFLVQGLMQPGTIQLVYSHYDRLIIGAVVPATITLLNIPKGVNVITWQLVNPCGGAVVSSVTSLVTVVDLTPPVITCPANVTINLAPGDCAAQFSYNVTATDNCPLFGPIATLNVPQAGQKRICQHGGPK